MSAVPRNRSKQSLLLCDFDAWHEPWQYDGPVLTIEFSRVSTSRRGALTLVIDSQNGAPTRVAYSISRRHAIELVIEDLQSREETIARNIGTLSRHYAAQHRDQATAKMIEAWAADRELDNVIWTDLPSNFVEVVGQDFTVERAVAYLEKLDGRARKMAFEYIRKAPNFIQTPLRQALDVT